MIKGTHCCHLRNPYCWKNSIWCFVVKQSITQRLIAQRSRFTRQSPVVALQPFLPNFLKFWGPSFPFKAALFSFDPWRFGLALALFDSNDDFAAHFQRMHVFRFCYWSRNRMWPASQKPVWSVALCLWGESAGPSMFWVFHYLVFWASFMLNRGL